ncbi:MAG: stage III sporulation protein AC [Hydrogenibacillus sp.]|nr:stage III sporulation protein AC [Hydrogenibacillus sp.]
MSGTDFNTIIVIFGLAVIVTVLDTVLTALGKETYVPWVNIAGLIIALGIVLDRLLRFMEALKAFFFRF